MRNFTISKYNLKCYLKQNKGRYLCFAFCVLVGVVVGLVIVASSDAYLGLITSDNKVLYSIINGTVKSSELFWRKFMNFIVPVVLIFLLSLNYYLGLLSYLVIGYQSALFVMSVSSIISIYGISGVLNFIFLSLPINSIYILILIHYSVVCLSRAREALHRKQIGFKVFDDEFLMHTIACVMLVLILVFAATIVYPLFIKNAIFIIF